MKKMVLAILLIAAIACAWFFSRSNEHAVDSSSSKTVSGKNNDEASSAQKNPDWSKNDELNQKISAKNVVHEIGQPSRPETGAPESEVRDERIGKENPSMIEHPKAEDLPPLDMMSTEDQIKFNKEIIMTSEEYETAKKKISTEEISPDVTELQKQLDIEVAADKAKAAALQQEKK